MRSVLITLALACVVTPVWAQEKPDGPTDGKAQKTYKEAFQALHEDKMIWAVDGFKKADKQDGGHCFACQKEMIKYGAALGDWKTAEFAAGEMVAEAHGNQDIAVAQYQLAVVLNAEGLQKKKDEFFTRAHDEIAKALAADSAFPEALFLDGRVLAELQQDDAAKARFEELVKMQPGDNPDKQRALRYINRPELARARLAPAFAVTTLDGQRVSMDDLQGQVVLLDFWATWCGPCREALPRMKDIARKFAGQPLVILSVSLDSDEQRWKDFIAKNGMTWPQYRDAGFNGAVAKLFSVSEIPHTFTIDSDGIVQEEHIGDASIEGKLKKLVARARESQPAKTNN
jgi:peroxiredoxin